MKKSTGKLRLHKTTIRILQGGDLARIVGGAPTADCTQLGPTCLFGTVQCPPPTQYCTGEEC
jgi:hypothetical protein